MLNIRLLHLAEQVLHLAAAVLQAGAAACQVLVFQLQTRRERSTTSASGTFWLAFTSSHTSTSSPLFSEESDFVLPSVARI
jgi:hypothetical protein